MPLIFMLSSRFAMPCQLLFAVGSSLPPFHAPDSAFPFDITLNDAKIIMPLPFFFAINMFFATLYIIV